MSLCLNRTLVGAVVAAISVADLVHAETSVEVDLNGVDPAELLIVDGDHYSFQYWSKDNLLWLEVFSGAGDPPEIERAAGVPLFTLNAGDRKWVFEGNSYAPQVSAVAEYSGALTPTEFEQMAEVLGFERGVAGAGSGKFDLGVPGSNLQAFLLAGADYCSMGGALCPVIFMDRDAQLGRAYVNLAFDWGVVRDGTGKLWLENEAAAGLLITQIVPGGDGGAVTIQRQRPRRSEHDLKPPQGEE